MSNKLLLFFGSILFFMSSVNAGPGRSSQLSLGVDALLEARVALYYRGERVTDKSIDFPLSVNAANGFFEDISDYFYVVGNIDNAKVKFADAFILDDEKTPGRHIPITGAFVFNEIRYDVTSDLTIPVLRDIRKGTSTNGFKVHMKSQHLAHNYPSGRYVNVFTLILTPAM
jgi:hypothetical protein